MPYYRGEVRAMVGMHIFMRYIHGHRRPVSERAPALHPIRMGVWGSIERVRG